MLSLFEKTDTFQERVTDSTIKVIRSELGEHINFEDVYREIEEHGPNLSRLIDGSSLCQMLDKHIRQDQPGRIVTITAMLSLGP